MSNKTKTTSRILKIAGIFFSSLIGIGILILFYFLLIDKEKGEAVKIISLSRQIVFPSVVILSLLFLTIIAAIAFRIIKRTVQLISKNKEIFGANFSGRLLSFGIIVFLFPKAILNFFMRFLHLIGDLIVDLPNDLYYIWFNNSAFKDKSSFLLEETLDWFLTCLMKIVSWLMGAFLAFFKDLPVRELFLALVLWIIIGNLISPLSTEKEKEMDTSPVFKYLRQAGNYLRNMNLATRKNIFLGFIICSSLYLTIVAIVSIPWLQGKETSEILASETLKERMEGTMLSKSEFDSLYKEEFIGEVDLLSSLDPMVKITKDSISSITSPLQLPNAYKDRWESRRLKIVKSMRDIRNWQKKLLESWKEYRQGSWRKLKDMQQLAIDDFEATTLSPMSVQEKATYFKEMTTWFRWTNSKQQKDLGIWVRNMNREKEKMKNDAEWQAREIEDNVLKLRQYIADTDTIEAINLPPIYLGDILIPRDPFNVYNYPSISGFEKSLPNPPEPGLGWGPFGWMARWLLRTKSLALALITGMLGFGLLGATISSFVREKAERKAGEPIIKNLADVIIRGLSAAIVVFLGVKGGLAVFTIGENEPNPYALFFVCLVGAVFSEDVWTWARERINQDLSVDPDENQNIDTA